MSSGADGLNLDYELLSLRLQKLLQSEAKHERCYTDSSPRNLLCFPAGNKPQHFSAEPGHRVKDVTEKLKFDLHEINTKWEKCSKVWSSEDQMSDQNYSISGPNGIITQVRVKGSDQILDQSDENLPLPASDGRHFPQVETFGMRGAFSRVVSSAGWQWNGSHCPVAVSDTRIIYINHK